MAEGYDRGAWNHTSAVIATLINTRLGFSGKPIMPSEIHPMNQKKANLPKIRAEKIAEFFKTN